MPTDNVLKLYSKTIQSSYLHYGFWDNPEKVDLGSLTLNDIKNAQLRYIDHLSSFIPKDTKTILDVGCGIGGNTEFLLNKGYSIEALSPDNYQKSVIIKKFKNKVVFHHCKFEDFNPTTYCDLILESESACYIDINKGFRKAREVLKDDGYLLVSDYFVFYKDDSKNLHLKSSHDLSKYLKSAEKNGFDLIKEYNQTDNTMLTLDYANYLVERFVNPAIDYGVFSLRKNYPLISRLIGKFTKKKWFEKRNQLDLINSNLFRKYRKYMIYLFKKI
tara:strand:- start:196 stop:1017 length:822 start_codon:yes stop_codon:yes gene_type:complete